MAQFTIDPSERWKSLPKGEYAVMVTKVEHKNPKPDPKDPTKEKFPYLETTMEVIEDQFKGEVIVDRLSLSPKARPRLAGFIHACGMADSSTKGEQQFDSDEFLSKVLIVKGDVETFNGVERFRPSSFKMHPDVARTLEGAMNQEAAAAQDEKPAPAAPVAAPAKPAAAPVTRAPSAPARRPI